MKEMIRGFHYGVKNSMKYSKFSLFRAIIEEVRMVFFIMGPKLYYKYVNGTAVPGVDFVDLI